MPQHLNPPLPTRSRQRARDLRQQSTDAERRLWYHLRAGRLNGYKFRRQHPVPPYVADFYCDAAKLVVELDGSQHDDASDAVRTRHIERQGLKVLRFWDNEVLAQTDIVLDAILSAVQGRTLTPSPSPEGRGE
ncbi:MAG TPA: endonuclease domain-containing protein [Gammaproteobacteria bacterium]|nr:endonuclease domain-containing protein [Gammaproteobacteria bacterium]